ncbi:MAG: AMIN domain-containing protein [Terriglobales bacterium]
MKLLRFIGVLLLMPAAAAAQSSPRLLASSESPAVVRSVQPLAEPNGPVVEIISSRPLVPAISKLENPPRLVIDLPNARLTGHERRLDFRGSEINGVRLNQFQQDPPVARIVVDLSKPISYTWDAAGNRLMIRLHPMEEAVKAVVVPTLSRRVLPGTGAPGTVVLAGSRVATGSAVTAGADTAVLRLGRGGEVLVCPRTTVSVTSSQNGRTLMLGMSTGALEAHYSLDAAADSILTPDFRILLAGPGEFHYGVSADSRGNTCIQALPGNTAAVIVSELLGDGTYQVKSTQEVMFHSGKLSAADTAVPMNCGCPPTTPPLMRASATATSDMGRPVPGSETADLPASKPNDIHVEVEAPIVFRASDPPPVQPAPTEEAELLPLRDMPVPTSFETAALPPKPAHHGFFGKIRGFFSTIFG